MVINLLCHSFDNAWVNTFTTMYFVEQNLNLITPFSTVFEKNDVAHQCVLFKHVGWDSLSMILHLDCHIKLTSHFLFHVPPICS
jgi:hypothetical protein